MKRIEAGSTLLESNSEKAVWQQPQVVRLHAGAAEGGDSFAGDGGNLS